MQPSYFVLSSSRTTGVLPISCLFVWIFDCWGLQDPSNNVLLVKIEGPVWYTIYHPLPVVKGVNKPLYSSANQWEKDIYGSKFHITHCPSRHAQLWLRAPLEMLSASCGRDSLLMDCENPQHILVMLCIYIYIYTYVYIYIYVYNIFVGKPTN